MKILNVKTGSSVVLQTEKEPVTIEAREANIIRFSFGSKDSFDSPLGILPPQKPPVEFAAAETDGKLRLSTDEITVTVDKQDGCLTWETSEGIRLLHQTFPEISAVDVVRYSTGGEEPVIRRVATVDGERSFIENLRPYTDRSAFRARAYFDWQPDERIHGLGQSEDGVYDQRGGTRYLYQHNMRIPVPFFVSSRGYGVLFDCGSLMTCEDSGNGSYFFLDAIDRFDMYFIYGSRLDDIIAGFRKLTGNAALPPKWAFGYVQSKETYDNQDELVETAREYRRRHIPLDCIVQDWHTWNEGVWGDKSPDKTRYPDIASANHELHDMNVHTMVSVWPNMNAGGRDHKEFFDSGFLLGDYSTYDAFEPEARRIYWKQCERELFSGGFDSWWCDSTEPFSGSDWCGEFPREPWERFQLVGGEHKKYLDPAKANLYALKHAQGIYENQRKAAPGKRVLNLTRSGCAGIQQYGTMLWSGDITATWDTLRKQITEGLNLCMSGMPWWTLDIGGFFTVKDKWQNRGCGNSANPNPLWFWRGGYDDGVNDPGYCELYVRWIQLGAFLPMFRSHGTDTPREIWRFGEPGTEFYDAIEKFIRLRYTLMPYIYSIAGGVWRDGGTMLRSLLFDFAEDSVAAGIHDQFMLGGALMVCPVTNPMYFEAGSRPLEAAKTRRCYLPKGTDWYDFWTHQRHTGGGWLEADAPLDIMPLFVRAGSILPMETARLEYACEETREPLEIKIYTGTDGKFTVYEDSGDGYDYENGRYNRIPIVWNDTEQTLEIGRAEYDFPQSMRGRSCIIRVNGKEKEILYQGEAISVSMSQEE